MRWRAGLLARTWNHIHGKESSRKYEEMLEPAIGLGQGPIRLPTNKRATLVAGRGGLTGRRVGLTFLFGHYAVNPRPRWCTTRADSPLPLKSGRTFRPPARRRGGTLWPSCRCRRAGVVAANLRRLRGVFSLARVGGEAQAFLGFWRRWPTTPFGSGWFPAAFGLLEEVLRHHRGSASLVAA
jgi:hypothetical protein